MYLSAALTRGGGVFFLVKISQYDSSVWSELIPLVPIRGVRDTQVN